MAAEERRYEYWWNAAGQLEGATRTVDGNHDLTMYYVYDASGGRVTREKSDIDAGQIDAVYQDLYISGSYERRQVQLRTEFDQPRSVYSGAFEGNLNGRYDDLEGSRLVKYASGARIQWKVPQGDDQLEPEPQIFLSLGNHLGSTSAVIDYEDGALV